MEEERQEGASGDLGVGGEGGHLHIWPQSSSTEYIKVCKEDIDY